MSKGDILMKKVIPAIERFFNVMAKAHWLIVLDRAATWWLKLSQKAAKQKVVVNALLEAYNKSYPDDKICP